MSATARSLLFISPTWPRPSGNGLAMRAQAVARALARRHEVHVSVPRSDGTAAASSMAGVARLAQTRTGLLERGQRWLYEHWAGLYQQLYSIPGDWERPGSAGCRSLARITADLRLDRAHVFRQYMAAFAGPFFGRIACQLDLDESEARTRRSLARLARLNGDLARAALLESEAEFYARTEAEWLPRFERIFVSSEPERRYLLDRYPRLAVEIIPNSVALPPFPSTPPARSVPVLLFAGNLGYYPNADAVRHLLREIVPMMKAQARMEFQVRIVGRGASRELQKTIAREPSARWLGFVPDVSSEYWQACLAVVPLRSGGGTRIKILEAFAHRVPVVSTSAGVEGLDARPEEHLLVGDSAESFASCCVRLLQDESLRRSLATRAHQLVAERYTSDALSVPG